MDAGWDRWLPLELRDLLIGLGGGDAERRRAIAALERPPSDQSLERWERFRLVAPSQLDLPLVASELDGPAAIGVLKDLGLVAGDPPAPVVTPDPVETVLSLDHEEIRELETLRSAIDPGSAATRAVDLPPLDARFGGGKVGRNDPCPCGSGRKFKRCHGA